MRLYDFAVSHNCYKVRLFLGILCIKYHRQPVNLMGGESHTPEFLRMNPRGQVPVLEDGGLHIWESTAILIYLARKYADSHWFPDDAAEITKVAQWLAVAQNELLYGIGRAHWLRRGGAGDVNEAIKRGQRGLRILDMRLTESSWLAGGQPSIADIACYPHASLASEAGIPVFEYPNLARWCQNVESIPGYVSISDTALSG